MSGIDEEYKEIEEQAQRAYAAVVSPACQELVAIKARLAERRAVLVKAVKSCPSIYEGGEGEEYALMKQVCELDYILTGKWGKYHE